jgi:hypothetical protein
MFAPLGSIEAIYSSWLYCFKTSQTNKRMKDGALTFVIMTFAPMTFVLNAYFPALFEEHM